MRGGVFARSDMTSLPVSSTKTATQTTARSGDAAVVRGIAAGLVLLALAALLLVERPAAYGVAATILASALGLFAAANWRRAEA